MNFGHGEILFKQGINIPTGIPVAHASLLLSWSLLNGLYIDFNVLEVFEQAFKEEIRERKTSVCEEKRLSFI